MGTEFVQIELWSIQSFSPKGTQRKQSFMSLVSKTTLKGGGRQNITYLGKAMFRYYIKLELFQQSFIVKKSRYSDSI